MEVGTRMSNTLLLLAGFTANMVCVSDFGAVSTGNVLEMGGLRVYGNDSNQNWLHGWISIVVRTSVQVCRCVCFFVHSFHWSMVEL